MMTPFAAILAARDEDPLMKIIFFVIFALIWGVGALIKMASKRKEQEHRDRVRAELEASRQNAPDYSEVASRPPVPPVPPGRATAGYQPPVPPPARGPTPYRPPATTPRPPQRKNTPPKRPPPVPSGRQNQKQKKQKKPADLFAQRAVAEVPVEAAPSKAMPAVSRPAGPQVDADQLRSWLRPKTLRDQFILTEILQRPLALRPRSD